MPYLKTTCRALTLLAAAWPLLGQVMTYHYDNARTGATLNEAILNTTNVNVSSFGKLFSLPVDGQVYAQPLYQPNVSIPQQGPHNVLYVATENNSVYAFDADSASAPLWTLNLGTAMPTAVCCRPKDLTPQAGITGTPVIDPSSGTLYVIAETYESGAAIFRLHALDTATGTHKLAPVVISGSVSGRASDGSQGVLAFTPMMQWQRTGLLLMNGTVYFGFGSHQDTTPYHGWLFSYDAATLQQTGILCLSPDQMENGVWQGGVGLTGDVSGNVYFSTGNGPFDVNSGGRDYGDSVVKVGGSNGLSVLDYFTPAAQASYEANDLDVSSSGVTLIPGTNLAIAGAKSSMLYLLNTTNLGQYNNTDKVVQEWSPGGVGFWGGNVLYYNKMLYVFPAGHPLMAFSFNGSTFSTTPSSTSTGSQPANTLSAGPSMTISANGNTAGTGIVWGSFWTTYPQGIFRAFDASNVSRELWNSTQNNARDNSGSWAKWTPPVVANGKVYLATFDNLVNVYGLLAGSGGGPVIGTGGGLTGSGTSSTMTANLTQEGASDWVQWSFSGINRKSGVTAQISNYSIVGQGNVNSYDNDPRGVSWTDGTPVASATNETGGLYVAAASSGFSFTAPADATARQLIVHVGGYQSAGTLTAHLSDTSAPDYVDMTTTAGGSFDRNYTLSYHAGSAGQTLKVTWVMSAGNGNVTLNAAALSPVGRAITATGGTTQSAAVNTNFATALQATVMDANGNPVGGATVTFTAPASGPSASFSGSATATALTNSSGVATAPALTANSQTGSYKVIASAPGAAVQASFNLANTASSGGGGGGNGILSGSGTSSSSAANLTLEGTSDWVHWGDGALNRKSGVSAQISNYAVVGQGNASSYNNDPRGVSWTDGTPVASASNNTNGVYINSTPNGYSFTASADATTRQLIVHVGGYQSGGTFTAHLSDTSAPDYVDVTSTVNGQFDRNYTLSYKAASSGQTLRITWVMSSGGGNVTMNGAALSGGGTSTSENISATAGTTQSAAVNTNFATALQATVMDANGNPVGGATVTFTAPASGASASFSGSATATALTNSSGVATAPALTANSQTGSFKVIASAPGAAVQASFNLANTASSGGGGGGNGILTGSGTSSSSAANLTLEGTSDWVHWGDGALNRKGGVSAQISNYAVVGQGNASSYNNDPRGVSWTDGTPVASAANNTNGVYINSTPNGYSFTASADANTRQLIVHVGGYQSAGTLTAHLSDTSAPDYVDLTTTAGGSFDRNYTITYHAGSAGQTLKVTWVMSAGNGNVTLNAAALSPAGRAITGTGGATQSAAVNTNFATALQATVMDASGNPVGGATVTFTAPASGPSASFSGSATATAVTNSSGVATAPALTANSQTGSYKVIASAPGAAVQASFNLANTASSGGGGGGNGILSGFGTSSSSAANLTLEGTSDWVHWGDGALNRKSGVSAQILNYAVVGQGNASSYNNDPRGLSWTDGTPVASASNNTNGVYINSTPNGYSFTAPADATTRQLIVHVGGYQSAGTFTAHLSDTSAPDYVDVTSTVNGQFDRNYTLSYRAASSGQTLRITWVMSSGGGNVTMNGAALR